MTARGDAPRPRGRSTDAQLRLMVAVAALLAAAVEVAALVTVRGLPHLQVWQLVLVLAVPPLAELDLMRVRYGHDNYSFSYGEAALLVCFSLVGAPWFVLASLPTLLLLHLGAGRGLLKSLYNSCCFVLGAGTAAVVVSGIPGWAPHVGRPGQALTLLLAVASFSTVSSLLTCTAVTLSQQLRFVAVLRENVRLTVLVWAGNVSAASLVLAAGEHSPATLLALPPALVLLYGAYRAFLSARQERDVWQQLEAAARELNVLDEDEVIRVSLRRTAQLFRCEVELALVATGRHGARLCRLDDEGELVVRGLGPLDACAPAVATSYVDLAADGTQQAVSTCLVAPLEGPGGQAGVLRLLFGGPVRLSARERQVLATFARTVSTTLLNAGLHADVHAEAGRQAHEAAHDPLTGLANRLRLAERTTRAFDEPGTTALLLLDLDHFKQINDTLGHAAGDVLLKVVAGRLRRLAGDTGTVARLGGDEFAVLLPGLGSPCDAEPVAESALRLLSEPVEFEGLRLSVEGSIGIACHPDDADTADELFRRADVAMYQAKVERGSWLRYDPARDDSSVQRLALVAELRAALRRGEVVVHYQPQVDLVTSEVVGAEALARWAHPQRGLLPPSEFVGVVEQSGLMRPFTLAVLDAAVAQAAAWRAQGRSLSVSVNLGARCLLDRQLPMDVAAVLGRHHLPARLLVLEITETSAASELDVVEEVLAGLRRLGVAISVDDFGTGFSSLAFLQRTSVHELKVDRSFVTGMLESENDHALVRATVQLAHSLGARAVAEGVESQAHAAALLELGCDLAQGYHFGRPVPADELDSALPVSLPSARSAPDRHLASVTTRTG